MARRALLSSALQQSVGDVQTVYIPAPTKGWNTAAALGAGDPLTAPQLQNLYPTDGGMQVVSNSVSFATKSGAGFITLAVYKGVIAADDRLFAAGPLGIYNVTAGGAIGALSIALTNGYLECQNFTNSAGDNFLVGVNGVDSLKLYGAGAWASITGGTVPAITGVTTSNLCWVWTFKRRLFFVEKGTGNAWFLPVDSIAGAASKFPVGPNFSRGGFLLSGATWTLDGGNGPDDYCVFISSEGEAIVYAGTDPASASTFGLVGSFFIGKPTTRRCSAKVGADLWITTELGTVSMTKVVKGFGADATKAVSGPIYPTWTKNVAAAVAAGWTGWSQVVFPAKNAFLVGLPLVNSSFRGVYAVNMSSGAWTSMSWQTEHMIVYNNKLYGTMPLIDSIMEFWPSSGGLDTVFSGDGISVYCQQAYQKLSRGRRVQVEQVRMQFNNYTTATTVTPGLAAGFLSTFRTDDMSVLTLGAPKIMADAAAQPDRWYSLTSQPASWGSFFFAGGIRPTQPTTSIPAVTTWTGTEFQIRVGVGY